MSKTKLLDTAQGTVELPIIQGTKGDIAYDITKLYQQTGICMLAPAYQSVAACPSKITYIDGEKGILEHRGYDVKALANQSEFIEVAYLLLKGELPTGSEKQDFLQQLKQYCQIEPQLQKMLQSFAPDAHPMPILIALTAQLASLYEVDNHNIASVEQASLRMLAQMPILVAMVYRYKSGKPFIAPDLALGYIENFLYMCFGQEYTPQDVVTLDKILLLHADHEQNASTSTMRLVGSSGANMFACVSSAISSLWGPAHGGANEAVIKMLAEIGSQEKIAAFIAKAKDKQDPFKLNGFGHRIYRNYDPRAQVLKQDCHALLTQINTQHPSHRLLAIAQQLEAVALADEYFVKRKLFPNVDFYSGIAYQAMGIPTYMFTPMFALARTVGWLAQWQEMLQQGTKINRPRQIYIGPASRKYPKESEV